MTASQSLPVRPSLDSLRKQAKKLARAVADGDAAAIARAQAQLPSVPIPLTQRNAQLVIAREYGYAGWRDLTAEVARRLRGGLDEAVSQARRAIHDNDVARLGQLLREYPALLTWQGNDAEGRGGLLGMAAGSYGDSFDPNSETHFTRAACAALLLDAGAVVSSSVCEGLLESRARGLLRLFRQKDVLPATLPFLAALGDLGAVRAALDDDGSDMAVVARAFDVACRFEHRAVASLLLDRAVVLDAELGARIDAGIGRAGFVGYVVDNRPERVGEVGLWRAFVMERVVRAISSHSGHETSVAAPGGASDLPAFRRMLQDERWLLGDAFVDFQARLIERATLKDRGEFISALFDLEPAILRRSPPPSQALEFAFTYARPHLVPSLTRIWPLPDDLPHAAGMGDLERVQQWFDASGAPAFGDLARHYPSSAYMPKGRIDEYARQWGPLSAQRVLDAALAWAVLNRHFVVADFLLTHGADINTTWSSHEPASLLHELVFHANYESMRFVIDRGIDMTIRDHRWNATARGWAQHAANDEGMARWLEEAERQRESRTR